MNCRVAARSRETHDEYIFQPLISSVPQGRKKFILDGIWDPSQAAEGMNNLWIVSIHLRAGRRESLLVLAGLFHLENPPNPPLLRGELHAASPPPFAKGGSGGIFPRE